jgi:type IV pilus assembly protein PilX
MKTNHRQHGVSLIFSLIALVGLSLAAVGLVRSVNTGSMVMGNLGFKNDATATADRGAEAAVANLASRVNTGALNSDAPAFGYYATSMPGLDATGKRPGNGGTRVAIDWASDGCADAGNVTSCIDPAPPMTINGNRVSYVVTRMCVEAGVVDDSDCSVYFTPGSGDSKNNGVSPYPGDPPPTAAKNAYYRVIVRVVGARGTTSFTETMLHF